MYLLDVRLVAAHINATSVVENALPPEGDGNQEEGDG